MVHTKREWSDVAKTRRYVQWGQNTTNQCHECSTLGSLWQMKARFSPERSKGTKERCKDLGQKEHCATMND